MIYWIISILTAIIIAAGYFIFFYESRKARILNRLPGPPTLPIIGNAIELNVSNEVFLKLVGGLVMLYHGLARGWIFFMAYALIADADIIQKVLTSTTYIDKSAEYRMLMPWLGTGLLTSKGQKWFHRRKLLTPTFHFKILDDFMDVFNEKSQTLVQVLREEFGDSQKFNIFPYITRCALDIICETAMGKSINAQRSRDSEYVKAVYRIGELIQYRQMRPWLHPDIIWKLTPYGKEEARLLKILHGFTEKVIAERKYQLLGLDKGDLEKLTSANVHSVFMKAKRRVAFLDLLLTARMEELKQNPENAMTDLDIREETDTFMFEGHDTTASNVNWTAFLLGCYPEYQKKVHEEMDLIFGNDKERPVTSEDLTKMKYLECCIKESLRIYPSVPVIARAINEDLQLDKGLVIPAGTTAFILTFMLHRNSKVFPEAETFLPDRFFPENCVGRHPFAYVPFSAGPRNCIGQKFAQMEEKVMLAHIFRNFHIRPAERREDIIMLGELILRPKNGLSVKLTPRT